MADAALTILIQGSRSCTGSFFSDDEVLRSIGLTDLRHYAVDLSTEPLPDIFTQDFSADS